MDRDPGLPGLRRRSTTWATSPSKLATSSCASAIIHIDVSMADDRFAGAGQIARVADNTVHLNVPEANLL